MERSDGRTWVVDRIDGDTDSDESWLVVLAGPEKPLAGEGLVPIDDPEHVLTGKEVEARAGREDLLVELLRRALPTVSDYDLKWEIRHAVGIHPDNLAAWKALHGIRPRPAEPAPTPQEGK